MNKENADKTHFLNAVAGENEHTVFVNEITIYFIGYVVISLILNNVRTSYPSYIVWLLIIIQFLLQIAFFVIASLRTKRCGYKYSLPVLLIIFILCRIENWEVIVMPITLLALIALSEKSIGKEKGLNNFR